MLKKLFNSDNSKVLLGNISASALGLMTFMLLARVLPKATFGEWAIFVAATGFADLLRTGLIRQAMVRFISVTNAQYRKQKYQIAAVFLHLMTIGIISVILWSLLLIAGSILPSPYDLFFTWYPIWMLISMPHMMDTWFSHALKNFSRMNRIRFKINVGFLAFAVAGFYFEYGILTLISAQLLIQGFVSLLGLLKYRTVFFQLRSVSWHYVKQIYSFGKHSLATLTGANLLKSADHMIVGALMGTEAVAIYAIPLKLMDLVEIPLRGFVMTSFSKLSVFAIRRDEKAFGDHFYQMVGMLSLLFIPIGLVLFLFPNWVITIIGGASYAESNILLQVFVIAMLIMPLDKYIGMSMDSINRPRLNAIKVWIMVIVNIIGDLIAILVFDSLFAVACITVITMVSGLLVGFYTHPYLQFSPLRLLSTGIQEIKHYASKFLPPVVDKSVPSSE